MKTNINSDEWTKVDQAELGWEGADIYVKDAEMPTIGMVVNAEVNSPDGRSPFMVMWIGDDILVATVLQGDLIGRVLGIEGTP